MSHSAVLARVRKSRAGQWAIRSLDVDVPVRFAGIPFPVHVQASRNLRELLTRRYDAEAEETEWLRARWAGWSWLFDVGANIGFFSWAGLAANPSLRCHLFEADPRNVATLRRTARAAGDAARGVEIVEVALGREAGRREFVTDPVTGKAGGLVSDVDPRAFLERQGLVAAPTLVEVSTLDAFADRADGPGLLKVDVEGAEVEVMAGGAALLARLRPAVLVEVRDETWPAIRDLMTAAGYAVEREFGTTGIRNVAFRGRP